MVMDEEDEVLHPAMYSGSILTKGSDCSNSDTQTAHVAQRSQEWVCQVLTSLLAARGLPGCGLVVPLPEGGPKKENKPCNFGTGDMQMY